MSNEIKVKPQEVIDIFEGKNNKVCRLFRADIAEEIGLDESIILSQISFCIKNKREKEDSYTFKEGKYWTFDSYTEMQKKHFPFYSESKIKRIINNLENLNLIESKKFNKKNYDQTKWYTVNIEEYANLLTRCCVESNIDVQSNGSKWSYRGDADDQSKGSKCSYQEDAGDQPIPKTSTKTSAKTSAKTSDVVVFGNDENSSHKEERQKQIAYILSLADKKCTKNIERDLTIFLEQDFTDIETGDLIDLKPITQEIIETINTCLNRPGCNLDLVTGGIIKQLNKCFSNSSARKKRLEASAKAKKDIENQFHNKLVKNFKENIDLALRDIRLWHQAKITQTLNIYDLECSKEKKNHIFNLNPFCRKSSSDPFLNMACLIAIKHEPELYCLPGGKLFYSYLPKTWLEKLKANRNYKAIIEVMDYYELDGIEELVEDEKSLKELSENNLKKMEKENEEH